MSRLIDSEVLMKRKQEEYSYYDITDSEFEDLVNSIPTAFDMEKVVEQLEEMKSLSEDAVAYEKRHGSIEDRLIAESSLKELNRVIDIVKKGGVE